ncbi:MAG: 23S rRNA (adenine(2503)-C(2))-methyltransferase RlmN, partial [Opitutae bacterium]|nr:23S rRNA (adenine(2503)-C(2))-methyltransferase RlmN [Opitutae bacterium]
ATREKIMPINKRYPMSELLDACEAFIRTRRKMITLEYILIDGVNDDPVQATMLAAHARRLRAKVNLIPYNKVDGLEWKRPSENRIKTFLQSVERGHPPAVTLRTEKGHDIDAACGQLRLREQESESGNC